MLSYRHAFHAGSFADVLKHVVLMRVLRYLTRKDAPLLYLDTHAGAGEYDLQSPRAGRTGEFRDGIGALWSAAGLCGPLRDYVELVRAFNPDGRLRRYPGSPRLAQRLLRQQDRLELCERHSGDFALLEAAMQGDRRVRCHADDGPGVAIARLPPPERRGLVFIDPSFEMKEDYARLCERIERMYRRFATGVYVLWYPLVDRRLTGSLKAAVQQSGLRNVLNLELVIDGDPSRPGMRGCGLFVVNPPWTLKVEMEPVLGELAARFAGSRQSSATVEQTLPE